MEKLSGGEIMKIFVSQRFPPENKGPGYIRYRPRAFGLIVHKRSVPGLEERNRRVLRMWQEAYRKRRQYARAGLRGGTMRSQRKRKRHNHDRAQHVFQ